MKLTAFLFLKRMFDLQIFILGLTILTNLFLGGVIIFKDSRDKNHLFFGAFVFTIIFWTFSMLLFRIATNDAIALIWLRLSYVAAGLIGIAFFAFTVAFTREKINYIIWLFLILMTLSISWLILQPWFMIQKIILLNQWEKTVSIDIKHYLLYGFYFCIFFFGSLLIIWKKYKTEVGLEKINLKYMMGGIFLAGILGTIFNLILPSPLLNNWRLTWLGPVFTLIFVYFIASAIIKYKLLNIRLIAVELFALITLIMTGVQIFFAETTLKILLNAVIFIFLLVFGILLIRSVNEEVKRREEIQKLADSLAKTTEELKMANVRLKELDQFKNDFISIASHQMKTPLTNIKGLLSMILEGFWAKKPAEEKEELAKVYASTQQLINLVDTLLNISRIETGRMAFNFEMADLEQIVKNIINDLAPLTKAKNLQLSFTAESLPKISVDALTIRQVIMNLIDNAIKYTPEGKITLELKKEGDNVIFKIVDTGIGFSAEQSKQFFEKFYRTKNGAKTNAKGSGVGLYAASEIIKAHRGQIGAESPGIDKGSTFWFKLPLNNIK